ncbi:class I SAM-dependent methyltransferase [Riemerella columbipharyngis]|uniref:Uncharacterized protein n=1 Tax=Riemerella columbipharyngis TaxID=1071918 RepID=A0A1G6YMV0_9FLAO|nr:class I SAM-dependent methyltransferase [Riemerella columbipharyngis]SDD91708.1 Conserved hypothetical protein 95 [Riemerella columbipharyngis]
MINHKLTTPEIQDFIAKNLQLSIHDLILKKQIFEGVSNKELAEQIVGRNKAKKKFPFLDKEGILFPPHISLEQASSQTTAEYKAGLMKGKKLLDLTSGLAIDAYFLSNRFEEATLVEQNSSLLELVCHNWNIMNKKAVFINNDLQNILSQISENFDWIYIDPARRDTLNRKKFLLEDLSPNLLEIQDRLLEISENVMVKLSPIIDLKYLTQNLKQLVEIHIIAVRNEVKEVVCILSKKPKNLVFKCVNLESTELVFDFEYSETDDIHSEYSYPEKYLYIPNNAVLKSGAFDLVSNRFNIKKLHPNTHLYTSDMLVENFPGRVLEVNIISNKKEITGQQFNIISKNYPLSPEEIKKKYRIKDGGSDYVIFTQSKDKKIILSNANLAKNKN